MKLILTTAMLALALSANADSYYVATNYHHQLIRDDKIKDIDKTFIKSSLLSTNEVLRLVRENCGSDIQIEDIMGATYELNLKWNHIACFEHLLRRQYMYICEHGLYLGLVSAEFDKKYSNPKLITGTRRVRNVSDEYLMEQLKKLNRDIIKLGRGIITSAVELEGKDKGELGHLLKTRDNEWDRIYYFKLSSGKSISEFLTDCQSFDDTGLLSWELGEEKEVFGESLQVDIDSGQLDVDPFYGSNKMFKIALSSFLVKNMDQFEGRIDELQKLSEKRALIRTEQEMRKLEAQSYNRAEPIN